MCVSVWLILSAFFLQKNPRSKGVKLGVPVKETSLTLCIMFFLCQIVALNFLVYNFVMKKFFLTLLIFAIAGMCFANELDDKIKILYAGNNIKEAFTLLLSIPEDQRNAQHWLLMGNILQDEGKNDDAVFMYNRAISADPKYYKAYYNLGNIYMIQNKPNMAVQQFKKAVKYNPEFAYGYYNLGCAYLKAGKPKAAKWEFYKAIDLNNQEADFYYNLAYTFKILNKEKQAKEYLDIYNKLIERGN